MTPIFGPTRTTAELVHRWIDERGGHQRFHDVVWIYFMLCPLYEIPVENAIGQAAKETDDGNFTGKVPHHYHNWCGLKTKDANGDKPEDHKRFESDVIGAEAHLQHLRRYGGRNLPAGRTLFDPRWSLVTKFTDTIQGLGGAWAPAASYGTQLAAVIKSIPVQEQPMTAQIPGFKWVAARDDHYTVGRTAKIRGGAQHYSDGYNSLDWLTWSSGEGSPAKGIPPDPDARVSATFLVKHNPTMEDRGWQLVRIEDTPWTTAFANPYTVSIEYEHDGEQSIPDIAYQVLAQTWLDVIEYVAEHGLGDIPIRRGDPGIEGHKFWVGNASLTCPDGIDIDRLVSTMQGRTMPKERKFPTGFSLKEGFLDYYIKAEKAGVHWSAIGVPLTAEIPGIDNGETLVTVQRTDVGWLQYNPNNSEVRMATNKQRRHIEKLLGIDGGIGLSGKRLHLIGEELVDLGTEIMKATAAE